MKKRIGLLNNISSIIYSAFPMERYEIGKDVDDPHGLIVRSADCTDMYFNPSLLAIARAGAGYNNIPVERCTEAGICVFNTPGGNANAVKELVLSSMIGAYRNVYDAMEWVADNKTEAGLAALVEKGKSQFVGPEIAGKKLGLIGLGAVGALVANDAYALGMEVYGYDPFISVEAAWSISRNIQRAPSVEAVVAQCDVISIHAPLNNGTRGILNEDAFSKMKKGTLLLNFARAELVDTEALKKALSDGTVAKYVTDFPNDENKDLENIILIPHLAASTPESEENCAGMAARQLYDYLATGNIRNSVNLPACELEPYEGGRITFVHTNTPNMVGQITSIIADENINIAHMNNRSREDYAYTMIDVDQVIDETCIKRLSDIEGMVKVRVIKSAY
ncbi:phosphoglycerate dehydrogenase [Eubacteriales bacterium OttesenSCG-928-M02]|nr:phosphoglycerate dehydrogenase [Eubacteriales bacterium OttesenSCG-928-M02]